MEIDDGSSNSPKVGTQGTDKPMDSEPPTDLPPVSPIERPNPEIGMFYFFFHSRFEN